MVATTTTKRKTKPAGHSPKPSARSNLKGSLRNIDERFRALFNSIDEGFCIVEAQYGNDGRLTDYRFLETNHAFEAYTGLSNSKGRSMREIVPPDEFHWFGLFGRVVETGKAIRFRNEAKSLKKWFDVHAFRLGGEGSRVIGAVLNDITHRKRGEERLQHTASEAVRAAEANAKFRTMFEQGTQFAGILTLDGTVVEANRLCLDACGFTEAEIIGRKFWDCGWWNGSARLMEMVRAATRQAASGTMFRTESSYFIADGSQRYVDLTIAPVKDESGRVLFVAATGNDITDIKETERRLHEQDRRKDEFLATLAHELRNPLAPIRNGLQILQMGPGDAVAKEVRDMMSRQLSHMVRLIDDLLDLSRVSRGKIDLRRECISLQAVVGAAIESTRPLLDAKGHSLAVSLPQEPVWLQADLTRLAQVLSNLLNNAAKYTRAGGSITLDAFCDDGRLSLTVTDNGAGIAPEMIGRVFDMFAQVSPQDQGGLGIGLALVKKLVEMHDGTITAQSQGIGHGSVFTVTLPVLASADKTTSPDQGRALNSQSEGKRILVVDDNTDAAKSLGLILEYIGHEIHLAHTGPDALHAFKRFRPEIAFLDIGLPGMNGYEVARRLRAMVSATPVVLVALTGWGSEEDKRRCRNAGFDYHLTKPVEASAVADILDRTGT